MLVRVVAKFIPIYTCRRYKGVRPFTPRKGYKVHKIEADDEGTGWVVLCNNLKELWWVKNHHVRVVSED